jgi:NhaP-type Na+/H+ or K+/H+ antiporter
VDTTALAVVAATIFLWGAGSARLGRADVTGPMVFVSVGVLLTGTGLVRGDAEPEAVLPLVEIALVWVLFSDAARVPLRYLRTDAGRCLRLLGVGLPLTVLAG